MGAECVSASHSSAIARVSYDCGSLPAPFSCSARWKPSPTQMNSSRLSLRARELAEAGKIAEAIPVAQRAAELAKHDFGEDSLPTRRHSTDLAELYRQSGRWDDAEKLFKRARSIREKIDPDQTHRHGQ